MTLQTDAVSVVTDTTTLLDQVTIELTPGEVVGVIGPNGAGKSTLLRALAGLIRPDAGSVNLDGTSVGSLSARQRAHQVAFVAQDTTIPIDLGVLDLVLTGRYARRRRLASLTTEDLDVARASLASVGMAHVADRSSARLSGGERQLVQIARGLAQQARFLLLDEPTSALDIRHQLRIFDVMRRQADAGVGVGVVLHDLNEASHHCDRLIVIAAGRVVADAAPRAVMTPALLRDVYRVHARVHLSDLGHPHIHPLSGSDS